MPRVNDIDFSENRIGHQQNEIYVGNQQANAFKSKRILDDMPNNDILNTQRIKIEKESPVKGELIQKSEKNTLISQMVVKEQEDDGNCFLRFYKSLKKFYNRYSNT